MRVTSLGSGACIVVTLLSGLLAPLGCAPDPAQLRAEDARPNLLLISMDTTRADHLSAYGYERDTTPNLRELARQGARFDAAYAPSATTGPSHASLFTSLYPMTHRVTKNGHPLAGEYQTLAEILAAAGFETAAVVSSYVLNGKFGYGQGFDLYDDDVSQAAAPSGVTQWEGHTIEGKFHGRADDTTRRALQWLDDRARRERPFFLFAHYFDPHSPYLPPPSYRPPFEPGRKAALKLHREVFFYDTLISFTDREIGRLLAGLDERRLARDTVVMVVGDHGEGLMQHGHMFHGVHIYEEGVRVPLIVRWPARIEAGRVLPGPVQLVDLAPTILELTGVQGSDAFRGESLARLLRGEESGDSERPIYLYRRHYEPGELTGGIYAAGEKFGIRVGRWKLIEGPDEKSLELFDLESDPGELSNLAASEPKHVERLRLRLSEWRRRHTRDDAEPVDLSEEDRARLQALGYVE